MNTFPTSLDKKDEIDSRLLEHSKNIMKALNPNLDIEQLDKIAEAAAKQIKSISDSSANLEEFVIKYQEIKRLCEEKLPPSDQSQLQSTLLELELEKEKILKDRNLTLGQPFDVALQRELEDEMSQATLRSIQKAQDLQQQTCKTCNTPNRLIRIDSQSIQHLLKKCSQCKKVMYCSKDCQRKDWPRHKKVECLQ